jgi:chromosome segregation ATPase/cytoskeletal protein CcmA (bactofilin family)
MAPNDIDQQRGFWGNLFRRSRNVLEISEPYEGDLDSDQPLRIAPGVTLHGNVRAPEVWVAGLLQGYVLTPKLCVNAGGQLRGDVVAVQVDTEPEAKIRGRLTMLSADQFQTLSREIGEGSALMAQDELRTAVAQLLQMVGEEEERATTAEELSPAQGEGEPSMLPVPQGTGITSPTEVELIVERAREKAQAAQALQIALDQAQAKIARLEAYQERIEQHPHDPDDARQLLEQREAALIDAELQIRDLEQQLSTALGQREELSGRVESLESALQASVQHGADQEEALVRWQELAESTRADAAALESEVDRLNSQLRDRNEDVRRLQQTLAALQEEQRRAEAAQPEKDSEVTRLETRLVQLEHLLEDAQNEAQEQHDQILWYRTSLTAIEEQLQAAQSQLKVREESVAAMEQEVENQRALAEKWQNRAGHLSELLYDATKQLKELDDRLQLDETPQTEPVAGSETLRQQLREREAQVESLELEVARYHKELESQGRRLAEARAELADSHLSLERMREQLRLRGEEVEKIKRLASSRIRKLEAALAQVERRRSSRGSGPS